MIKFYKCSHCGNIITFAENKGVPVMCCGQKMEELVPNTTDAAVEKHVPVYEVKDGIVKVSVSSVEHPMQEEHYIQWVVLEAKQGSQFKKLVPGQKPEVLFAITSDDEAVAVYGYCNLHGLWKA